MWEKMISVLLWRPNRISAGEPPPDASAPLDFSAFAAALAPAAPLMMERRLQRPACFPPLSVICLSSKSQSRRNRPEATLQRARGDRQAAIAHRAHQSRAR